jgi:hypothetical protein
VRFLAAALLALLAGCATPVAMGRGAAGIYDGSQAELAATLELKEDGRYAYYLSYGAIDEVSQGVWRTVEGGLVLDSDPAIAPAFDLKAATPRDGANLVVALETPEGMPREAFSALVTMADGSAFAVDFEAEGLTIPLAEGERVAQIMLALPVYDLRSQEFAVPPGTGVLSFRFLPNDLGVLALDDAFLPRREGAFLLERFDRMLAFRRVDP